MLLMARDEAAPLLGRDQERRLLRALLDEVAIHGRALVLRGEPGVGKSRLLSAAAGTARERGMSVLTATGVQSEVDLPFAGLLAIYLARGLTAIVYVRLLGRSRAVIAGVLQATSLTVIVAATQIGLRLGVLSQASAAGLVAAGLLSVVISPVLGLMLLRGVEPKSEGRDEPPTPVMPMGTAEGAP